MMLVSISFALLLTEVHPLWCHLGVFFPGILHVQNIWDLKFPINSTNHSVWVLKCQLEAGIIDVPASWQQYLWVSAEKWTSGQRGANDGPSLFRNPTFTPVQVLQRQSRINSVLCHLWWWGGLKPSPPPWGQQGFLQPQDLGWTWGGHGVGHGVEFLCTVLLKSFLHVIFPPSSCCIHISIFPVIFIFF